MGVQTPNTTYATPSPDAERTASPSFLDIARLQAKPSSTPSIPLPIASKTEVPMTDGKIDLFLPQRQKGGIEQLKHRTG